MNKHTITLLVIMLTLGWRVFAADDPATTIMRNNLAASVAWIARPGISANPAIAPEFWATNRYRDFYTTRSNWDESGVMGFVECNPSLPRVLLIGDSISMGYTLDVRQMFKGKANVYRISGNGGDMTRFLASYPKYLAAGTNWDLIHFNWGLHDIVRQDPAKKYDSAFPSRFTVEEYSNHLEQCVAILKSTGAHLVWASTTPVPPHAGGRVTGDEVVRNAVAAAVMQQHGIETDDLYSLMKMHGDMHAGPGNVHFTGTGYFEMARQITKVISHKLGISVSAVTNEDRAARLVNHWRFNDNYRDEAVRSWGYGSGQACPASWTLNLTVVPEPVTLALGLFIAMVIALAGIKRMWIIKTN